MTPGDPIRLPEQDRQQQPSKCSQHKAGERFVKRHRNVHGKLVIAQGEEGTDDPGGAAGDKAVDPAKPSCQFPQQQQAEKQPCSPPGDLPLLPLQLPQIGLSLRREFCAGGRTAAWRCAFVVHHDSRSSFHISLEYSLNRGSSRRFQWGIFPQIDGMDPLDPGRPSTRSGRSPDLDILTLSGISWVAMTMVLPFPAQDRVDVHRSQSRRVW